LISPNSGPSEIEKERLHDWNEQSVGSSMLATGLTLEKAVAEAKDIAKQFQNVTATPLRPEHVMGLIFSLAAQAEATNYA
jgi:hypothetical protein